MFLALSKRLLTASLFALTGWWELKCKYLSVCICFLTTVTLRVLCSLRVSLVSKKGILLWLHGELDGGAYIEMVEQELHGISLHYAACVIHTT